MRQARSPGRLVEESQGESPLSKPMDFVAFPYWPPLCLRISLGDFMNILD